MSPLRQDNAQSLCRSIRFGLQCFHHTRLGLGRGFFLGALLDRGNDHTALELVQCLVGQGWLNDHYIFLGMLESRLQQRIGQPPIIRQENQTP
eukprot:scaffold5122_cov60-Attheya_sp.AAC.5